MASWEPVDIDPIDCDEIEEEDNEWEDNLINEPERKIEKRRRFNATPGTSSDKDITIDKLRFEIKIR